MGIGGEFIRLFCYMARSVAALAVVGVLTVGCGRPIEPPQPVYIRVAGSTAMRHLLEELSGAFVKQNAHFTFDIEGGGSDVGLRLLQAGQVDVAASSWPPTSAELGALEPPVLAVPVARDGVVLIVHPLNPVEDLSLSQLRGIFRGRILDWAELGGKVGDILVVSREGGSGDRAAFETLVMDGRAVTPAAIVMPGSGSVVDFVASHPNAIGYVSMGVITAEVKAIAVEGVEPTPETVGGGTYPLSRWLALLSAAQPATGVQSFLDFVAGPGGQDIVKTRYVPIR